jgi:hypothetical protein
MAHKLLAPVVALIVALGLSLSASASVHLKGTPYCGAK